MSTATRLALLEHLGSKDLSPRERFDSKRLDFDPSKHPRAKDGKFGKKGSGSGSTFGRGRGMSDKDLDAAEAKMGREEQSLAKSEARSQPSIKTPKVDKKGAKAINSAVSKAANQTKKPLKNEAADALKRAAIGLLIYSAASAAIGAGLVGYSVAKQYSAHKKNQKAVKDTEKEWYSTLGVDKNADYETVKKAYKEKAKKMHPDINKDPEAEAQMRNLNVAFDGIDKVFESKKAKDDLLDSLLKNDSIVLDFVESQHVRGKGGKFAKKGGGGSTPQVVQVKVRGGKRPRTVKGTATKAAIAAGGTTAVVMGAAGLAAAYAIGQAKTAAVDISGFDFPDGGPIDFSRYDDLEPGTMLYKGFETKGVEKGTGMLHYAVYTGKDPKTGEHMCVHSSVDPKYPGTVSIIPASIESQFALLSPEQQKKSSHYKPVPPSEINPSAAKFTPDQVIERANALIGQPYKYGGVRDNCETIARVIVEGEGRETQASKVGPRAKKIAYGILDTRLNQVRAKSDGRQDAKTASDMADMLAKRKSTDLSTSMAMEMDRARSEWEAASVPEPKPASTNAFRENVYRQAFRNNKKPKERTDADSTDAAAAFIESMGLKQPDEFAQDVDAIAGETADEAMSTLVRRQLWSAYFEILITTTHVIANGKTGEFKRDSAKAEIIKNLRQDYTPELHPRDNQGRFKKKSGLGTAIATQTADPKPKRKVNRGLALSVGVTAVAGVGAIAIVGGVGALVKESGEGTSDIAHMQFPKPDAEYDFSRYDDFEPGTIIRKAFTAPGYPADKGFLHYAIYKGKDSKTGEHVVIHVVPDPKDPAGAVAIVEQSIEDAVKRGGKAEKHWHSYYEAMPESESRKGPKTPTKADAVKRAESLVGQPFDYYSVRSNCESFARLIAEGTPYETQGPGVAQSKKDFVADLTKKMQDKARAKSPIWKGIQPKTAIEYADILAKMESGELSDSVKAEMSQNRQAWESAPPQSVSSKTNHSIEQIFGWTLNKLDKIEKKEGRRSDEDADFYALSGMKTPEEYWELVESVVKGSPALLQTQARTYLWSNYLQVMVAVLSGDKPKKDSAAELASILNGSIFPERAETRFDAVLTPRRRYLLTRGDKGFESSNHPRDAHGKFASKSGGQRLSRGLEPQAKQVVMTEGSGNTRSGESGKLISAGESYTDQFMDDPEFAAAATKMHESRAALGKAREVLIKQQRRPFGPSVSAVVDHHNASVDLVDNYNAFQPMAVQKMKGLQAQLKADSGLSRAQAKALVSKRTIVGDDDGSATKDLTDYFQTTGVDLPTMGKVVIDSTPDGRSYADPKDSKSIVISRHQLSKPVIYHEASHHLEYNDPKLVKASEDWIKKRSDGTGEHELSQFNPGYGIGEKAYRDFYTDPYVGRVYRENGKSKATEAISMGMQEMATPESMAKFYSLDPEHFNFTIGAIRPNGRTRKDSITVRDALIEWLQCRYDFDPGLHARDERGRFSVKDGDRGMGVWYEGRRTGVLVRAKNRGEAIEKAAKSKKQGGEVGTVRDLTPQEEAIAAKGRWVRTGPKGEKPGELDIPGYGPKPKKLREKTDD